ncbi:MAG TPA: AtpZ/AtpI family protein [Candidatus Sulfotelmatobacter sp.]|jgi:F0F1-type ATP synthase assembly protein I
MASKDPTESPKGSEGRENFWVQAARYSQLALVFPAAVVVGWLAGAGLDRWLHTTWLYLAGILLGIAAGFVELIRAFMRDAK